MTPSLPDRSNVVPFCPDCGVAGTHRDSCTMFPGEPVVHGNFEKIVPAAWRDELRGMWNVEGAKRHAAEARVKQLRDALYEFDRYASVDDGTPYAGSPFQAKVRNLLSAVASDEKEAR